MDTADLMGKTRSIEPGLRADAGPSDLCDEVGEGGGPSLLPVNMETGDSRGWPRDSRPGGRALCWPSDFREVLEETESLRAGSSGIVWLHH